MAESSRMFNIPPGTTTIGGYPAFASKPLGPQYVPTVTLYPDQYDVPSNTGWIMKVAEGIAANVLHNWRVAGGKPAEWNEAKYGSWAALVQRNAGNERMLAGDFAQIVRFLREDYTPQPGDWYQTNFGAYIPPRPDEYVLDPEYVTLALTEQQNRDKEEIERNYAIYKAELDIMRSRSSSGGSSGGGSVRYSGSSGSSAAYDEMALLQARLDMEWKLALLSQETEFAKMDLQERLTMLELEQQRTLKQAELDLAREQLEYQKQRDAQELALQRGAIVAKTMADPNDALQREYMLRMFNNMVGGQEPAGTAVDIFSGQTMNNGQPTTFSEIQEQNAQNWGMTPLTPGNPPVGTAPVPGPPQQPPAQVPAYAKGTRPSLSDIIARVEKRLAETRGSYSQQAESAGEQQDWRKDQRYARYLRDIPPNSWVGSVRSRKKRAARQFRNRDERVRPFADGTKNESHDDNTFSYTTEKFFIVGDSPTGEPTGNEELIINHDQGRVTVIPNKYFSAAVKAVESGRVKYAAERR